MTQQSLRELAAYHREAATNARTAARGLGDCPAASRFLLAEARHLDWAEQLTELADAFDGFRDGAQPAA